MRPQLRVLVGMAASATAIIRQELIDHGSHTVVLQDEPSYPAKYYTEQTLDHFHIGDKRTFKQKYYENFDNYKKGGPVFIYIGGEGPLSTSTVTGRTANAYFAQQMSGATVSLEHRFYGETQPFDSLATEHLSYLTSRQALEDLAQFQKWFTKAHSLEDSAFFCMGGSYPGSLASWYRLEFPDLTAGCWAASGPVQAQEDWPGFGEMVWRAMSTNSMGQKDSAAAVKLYAGYEQVAALIQHPIAADVAELEKKLNACPGSIVSQDDRDNWEMTITNYPGLIMQYNNSGSPHLEAVKKVVEAAETPLDAAWAVTAFLNVTAGAKPGECVDNSIGAFYKQLGDTSLPKDGSGNAGRTWTWQTCNEFGYFQTADAKLSTPNFYTRGASNPAMWQQVCSDIFGVSEAAIGARIAATNAHYGGNQPPKSISHVFYSNGELDAWSLLSVTSYPENNRSVSTMVAALGSHCVGLYAPKEGELPGATQVRDTAFALFKEWGATNSARMDQVIV